MQPKDSALAMLEAIRALELAAHDLQYALYEPQRRIERALETLGVAAPLPALEADLPGWRCASCRHWSGLSDARALEEDDLHHDGSCGLAALDWDEDDDHAAVQRHPGSLARIESDYAVGAWLRTRHDFGCVQWQPRQE
jgi:hypothetical protein